MDNIENLKPITKELFLVINRIFKDEIYATKAISISLKANRFWDDETRGFFSDTVYDITRNWRLLWALLDKEPSFSDEDLRQIIQVYFEYKNEPRNPSLSERLAYVKKIRAIRESVPDWLDKLGQKSLGKRWGAVIKSLNQKPDFVIRVNTLKTTVEQLSCILENDGMYTEKIDFAPDALTIKNRSNIFRLKSFQEGLFEVQDAASQMVSIFLDPKPGMLVVDACAGEGSKTLHLAALMKNRGRIIAMDPQDWRLKELRRRATKAGANNIETRQITSSKSYKRLKEKVDRLLLDVPCSGLGTLRRNPDTRWKISLSDIERLRGLQSELINRYCNLLKKEGLMVYSVCSILPSEAEEQVKNFISKQGQNFELVKEKRYWPDTDGTDGFYMALIKRK